MLAVLAPTVSTKSGAVERVPTGYNLAFGAFSVPRCFRWNTANLLRPLLERQAAGESPTGTSDNSPPGWSDFYSTENSEEPKIPIR